MTTMSEQKTALERSTSDKYLNLVEHAADGIAIIQDGVFRLVNGALIRMSGYSREELPGMPFISLLTPESQQLVMARYQARLTGKEVPSIYEAKAIIKGGRVRDIEINAALIDYEGRAADEVIIRDITERKQAEDLFRTLCSSSPVGIYIVQDGKFRYTNPQFQKLTGFSEDGLLGTDSLNLVLPEDRNMVRENAVKMLKGERCLPYEYRVVIKTGETRWVMETVLSTYYQGKRAALGNYMDITERKRMEKAVRESEERFRSIAETANDAIVTVDGHGDVVYWNPAARVIFGYSADEIVGKPSTLLIPPKYQRPFKGELKRVVSTRSSSLVGKTIEVVGLRKDGTEFPVELSLAIWETTGETFFTAIMRDITERKRAEERERQLQQKLNVASRLASIGEMAAGIAHEINNPLTAVIGFSQLLMTEDIPDEIRDDLKVIKSEAQRVARIVAGLLTFARQGKPGRDYVQINSIISRVLEMRSYEMAVNNVQVVTRLAPDLPYTIADVNQLQQVFLNIVLNAEKEMTLAHDGGKLSIKAERTGNSIRVSFTDDGPGISKENLDKVFDPFFTTREIGDGTGLGLSICHGIITAHNGRIYAESELGKGATFVVELPIVVDNERTEKAGVAEQTPRKPSEAKV